MSLQGTGFSTRHLPSGQRVAGWAEAASDRFVESGFEVQNPEGFIASMRNHEMADLSLTRIHSAGHHHKRVTRSLRQAARAAEDFFLVSVQLEGSCRLSQGGRDALLRPGEFALYDTRRPYELQLAEDYGQAVLRIPRRTLLARLPQGDGLAALAVPAEPLPSRLLLQMVRELCRPDTALDPRATGDLAQGLLGVLSGGLRSLHEGLPAEAPGHASAAGQRERVKAHVAAHLGDPQLGVAAIAEALGLSTRYLHKLFKAEGCTLERWIWAQRLQACAAALADPTWARQTLTQVAYAHGFSDAAHFSRSFQQRYGLAPSAYRRDHAAA
ncbi:MAG TPA: helix-turn-helix domain-containing protein [Ideonella sp.]|nr:helix-turn-helix domain-containing protein [Ideonella sp.]